VEALIRWQHPTRGLLAPFHFIDPLEETGLIVPLGEWILLESCQAAKRWIDSGMVPIKVSVNLSSRQFQDPKLFSMIEQTLAITQLKAKYLELEITESMVMTDIENNNRALQQMQKLGISIAIDDFGTGYSSFSYLKALPLDTLKIDRSFVMDIPNDETDMEITAAIIAVAHKLKLNVVAEGIETKEQESFLTSEGCDIGQGYLFSKPIAEEELIKLLDKEIIEPSSAHVS
jgi:EAL domain-containing protein (putative c-di-GMP-specific phosphodiesterase class I)